MPVGFKTPASIKAELDKLEQQRIELEHRIDIIKENAAARVKLQEFCQQHAINRSDLLWLYNELPPMRISRKSRLQRIADRKHATNANPVVAKRKQKPHKSGRIYPPKAALVPFGELLRARRHAMGLSSVALSKIIDRDQSMITGWERGLWRIRADTYEKLEKTLGKFDEKWRSIVIKPEKLRDAT